MRDILFRAKCLDNYEWIEGWYYQKPNPCSVDGSPARHFISNCPPFASEIDHDTVCQYVGIKDKNGKKIFEGDIVVYDNSPYNVYCTPISGVIVWRNGSLCFKHIEYGSAFYRPLCSDDFFASKCEVVGNIYDNPEMVGEAE